MSEDKTIYVNNLSVAKVNGYTIETSAWNNLNALASYGTSSDVNFNTLTANISIPSGKTLTADGKTITAIELSNIAGLNQELKTTSDVVFNKLTANVSIPSGKTLTADGEIVSASALSYLKGLNQELKTTSNVVFSSSTTRSQPYIVVNYDKTMSVSTTYATITDFTATNKASWTIDAKNGKFTYTGTSNRVSINIALYVRLSTSSSPECACTIRLAKGTSYEMVASEILLINSEIYHSTFSLTTVIDIDTNDIFQLQIKRSTMIGGPIVASGNIAII